MQLLTQRWHKLLPCLLLPQLPPLLLLMPEDLEDLEDSQALKLFRNSQSSCIGLPPRTVDNLLTVLLLSVLQFRTSRR